MTSDALSELWLQTLARVDDHLHPTQAQVGDALLVTDLWWLGAELAGTEALSHRFLVEDQASDRTTFVAALKKMDTDRFVFLGSGPGLDRIERTLKLERPGWTLGRKSLVNGLQEAEFNRDSQRPW